MIVTWASTANTRNGLRFTGRWQVKYLAVQTVTGNAVRTLQRSHIQWVNWTSCIEMRALVQVICLEATK